MTLPKNWAISTIGELTDKGQYGWTTKASQLGEIKFLRTTDITKSSIDWGSVPFCSSAPVDLDKYLLELNDIVISRAGSVGFSRLIQQIPCKTVFASYLIRFKPCKAVVPRYLSGYLNSDAYWKGISAASVGIAVANVNAKSLAALPVPIAPLAEQRRIADKLDTVLTRVDALNDRLARLAPMLKRFRQSVLAAATSGRLTEDFWTPKFHSLGEVCEKITDGEHSTPKRQIYGRYLISARNVRDGYIDLSKVDFVGEDEFSRLRKRCDPNIGDVLLSCSGSVGRCALVDKDDSYVMVRSAALIRPKKEMLHSKYLLYVLQSPKLQLEIEESTKSTAQANIFLGPIKRLSIPLVSLEQQTEIVRRVEILFAYADRLEARLQTARTAADRLTPALLAKAFRGELVPQDLNDEPASELLRRLRETRAAEAPAKKARGRKAAAA